MRFAAPVWLAVLSLTWVASCAPEPVVVAPPAIYRDVAAQIASQTNVTAARMAGDWVIRQDFAGQPGPRRSFNLTATAGGGLVWTDLSGERIALAPAGPARWSPLDPVAAGFDSDIWVLWMDFDGRTAAIGTPSGAFGFIIDRNETGGADRIIAAREIMEWFGYDMGTLRDPVQPDVISPSQ